MDAAALVPVKSFAAAKARLRGVMPDATRRRLAEFMATRVVSACAPLPVFVACDDESVAGWAERHGACVLWGPGLGLNGAIDQGIATIAGKGFDHVVVCHGDVPLAHDLADLARPGQIVLVPDGQRDGTNVLARPCAADVPACYGGGSFGRHLTSALRSGWPVTIRVDARLALDIDTVDDCRHPLAAPVLDGVLDGATESGTDPRPTTIGPDLS